MEFKQAVDIVDKIRKNISKVIVGKDEIIHLVLSALTANGHVLLEDVPGTGKTLLAKSLAKSINGEFKRIQYTPDLMPSDVTGINVFNQKEMRFDFKPGPVFSNILLADEINRATPRSQAALLECMEEKQISIDGVTYKLEQPFFVIATQNPIETSGTFPLPEAQLDRFLIKLKMGYPTSDENFDIINRFFSDNPLDEIQHVATTQQVAQLQDVAATCHVADDLKRYIVALAEETRKSENIALGVSPRGILSMVRMARAYALVSGRDYVLPDDISAIAPHVLCHRIILKNMYGTGMANDPAKIVHNIMQRVAVPTEKIDN